MWTHQLNIADNFNVYCVRCGDSLYSGDKEIARLHYECNWTLEDGTVCDYATRQQCREYNGGTKARGHISLVWGPDEDGQGCYPWLKKYDVKGKELSCQRAAFPKKTYKEKV